MGGAEATAIVTGTFLSGAMMGLSMIAIPVFLDTNTEASQLLHQWARLYHYGSQLMPTMAMATLLLYIYVTIRKLSSGPWLTYAVAGATTITIIPFTKFVMLPTNNSLFELDASSRITAIDDLDHVRELITKWAWLHVARSLFPLLGAIIGWSGGK